MILYRRIQDTVLLRIDKDKQNLFEVLSSKRVEWLNLL